MHDQKSSLRFSANWLRLLCDAQNKTHPQRFTNTNHNGTVTFGELAGYVRQKVAWAAKTQFNQEQRPLLLPPLKPDDPAASLVLTAIPSLTSSEAP